MYVCISTKIGQLTKQLLVVVSEKENQKGWWTGVFNASDISELFVFYYSGHAFFTVGICIEIIVEHMQL